MSNSLHKFKRQICLPIITMCLFFCAALLSGCGNGYQTYQDFEAPASQPSKLVPVAAYETKEIKEYTNEGITEEPTARHSSEDGLCTILTYPSYYEVTLDYENGTPELVGKAYADTILQAFPDFEKIMEPYIYENIRLAFNGAGYKPDAVKARMEGLFESIPEVYKEEITGFATELAQGEEGFVENGKISFEEAVIIQMIPDALRPTACSALSLWGEKTESNMPITLRCLEWNLGSDNQMGLINSVTHMKNGEKSITTFGVLGLLDIISAVNNDGVFTAILDVGSEKNEPYDYEGKKCYTFDIRYALENFDTATEVGEFMVANSADYTWCHNLIITDEEHSYCAEDCVGAVAEKGDGFSILRDENTPLMAGLHWDSEDSLCVVNSFAAQGNQDSFKGSEVNIVRFEKYNKWVKEQDKFTVKDIKDMITSEDANQFDVITVHRIGAVQLIIVDYETKNVQVAFTGQDGLKDKPDFVNVGSYE